MSKEDLTKHLEHLMQLVEDEYVISMTTVILGENDRVIGNNVGEPMPAHGILLLQDMANEMRDEFMESPVKPYDRLRALGPEGGFVVVGEDGEEVEDDDEENDEENDELIEIDES